MFYAGSNRGLVKYHAVYLKTDFKHGLTVSIVINKLMWDTYFGEKGTGSK